MHELPARFALRADEGALGELLDAHPDAGILLIGGALPEGLLDALLGAAPHAGARPTVLVGDATRVFLGRRSVELVPPSGPSDPRAALDRRCWR